MDVLEPEDHALALSESLEERQERVEEAPLRLALPVLSALGRRGAELRGEPRELATHGVGELVERRVAGAGQRTHGPDERGIGELVLAELDAFAADSASAELLGLALELAQQAGLADARLAGHEHELWPAGAGVGQRGLQFGELKLPPDEARGADPFDHASQSIALLRPRPQSCAAGDPRPGATPSPGAGGLRGGKRRPGRSSWWSPSRSPSSVLSTIEATRKQRVGKWADAHSSTPRPLT
jgi:hypothetical protein